MGDKLLAPRDSVLLLARRNLPGGKMASNWLRRVAHALTLAIAAYGAGDAKSAVQEGQFNLFVTDPVPLEGSFFTGAFQFDDTLFLFSDLDGLYFAPVQSATITGGDSETCCYVYDPLNIAKVAY